MPEVPSNMSMWQTLNPMKGSGKMQSYREAKGPLRVAGFPCPLIAGYFRFLLMASFLILLSGCGRIEQYKESKAQAREESRQEAIREMGEKNRAYHEKRQRFFSSGLYSAAFQYLSDTLEELMPGCEMKISLEPGDFIDDTDKETLDRIPTDTAGWTAFFSRASLSFHVNHYDYGMDPEDLCRKLMERGISGSMNADEYDSDRWNFHADTGETELYRRPGV